MNHKYAFCISGTQSGCGKTTITLALLAAMKSRGFRVQPFKVGPDFIDPGLHTQIAGVKSRNLDGWMLRRKYSQDLFCRLLSGADMAIVEGVMGLYDGYDGVSESGSSAEMAKWLGIPVLLVVDARSMARSAAALVCGFKEFDRDLNLAGVIFNRIGGEGHLEYLREAMSANLPDIPVLGGIPREDLICIPERHLGLVTADEIALGSAWKENLIRVVEQFVDMDLLLETVKYSLESQSPAQQMDVDSAVMRSPCSESRASGNEEEWGGPLENAASSEDLVPIAVARDAAFCFYYPDNFELLEGFGARLLFFSPLAGESLPGESAGVYLGGGYPELFAETLSGNGNFLAALRNAASDGVPIYAECGGLMTLSRFIETDEGKRYPMAGILPMGTRMLKRRKALGYTEVVLRKSCLLGEEGVILRGHEFHYSEITELERAERLDCAYSIRKRKYEETRSEGYRVGSVLASYIHLHWGSMPGAAKAFVESCRASMRRKGSLKAVHH